MEEIFIELYLRAKFRFKSAKFLHCVQDDRLLGRNKVPKPLSSRKLPFSS